MSARYERLIRPGEVVTVPSFRAWCGACGARGGHSPGCRPVTLSTRPWWRRRRLR